MAYVSTPQFGSWLSGATSFLKGVIPSNTIVGKALSGNISGAAASTIKLVSSGGHKTPSKTETSEKTKASGPGLFDPGGFVEKNQTVLLLVAAGLAAFLIMKRKKA